MFRLLHNALLKILGKVGPDFGGGAFGGDFGDVVFDHELDELLEGGFGGVPAEFGLGLGGVTPEVYDVGGTIEVFADGYDGLADQSGGAFDHDAFFAEALAFEA